MRTTELLQETKIYCYHCGDDCVSEQIISEERNFCCQGCKTVYEILQSSELGSYYDLEKTPGINPKVKDSSSFEYLELDSIQEQLFDFKNETIGKVQFYIPQIHCSACLWLLENLYKIHPSIHQSRVNFLKKEVYLTFNHTDLSLRALVELLASLGYEPSITLNQLNSERKKPLSKRLVYQVGLAGFAFGNIMLFSLPEYLGMDWGSDKTFVLWFGWLNLIFATPVAFYSGQDYFKSAWISIKRKRLNIDVPIALGVLVLYLRSAYEIISNTGAGYFDSLCGLLFYLLLGRIFQEKVYHQLAFERDYRSYFPLFLIKIVNGIESSIPIQDIAKGDRILIKNGELIPVDGYLIKGHANIDNSVPTGESDPIQKKIGEKIFAGGRQMGEAIEMEVIRPLSQSKLTRLWNDHATAQERYTHKDQVSFSELTDQISQWFTPIILLIALAAGIFHWPSGVGATVEVVTAVLIIACPCALALAAPFTFGHAMRFLGRKKFYLREAQVIEKMAKIKQIVFDKTGTLTYNQGGRIQYHGRKLNALEEFHIQKLMSQSNHPLSRSIAEKLPKSKAIIINDYEEIPAKGIKGEIEEVTYRLGSAKWLNTTAKNNTESSVYIEINGELVGYFSIASDFRQGLKPLLEKLEKHYKLSMISGDQSGQRKKLELYFPENTQLLFEQSPEDKLTYIKQLQEQGQNCMMVGDGLNDAGALLQSDVGVSIAEDINAFSPACDVILGAEKFKKLAAFLEFSRDSKKIVIASFVLSFLYNIVGLSFAVQGMLSPVFAAILMPLSSISVVGFVSIAVWWKQHKLN